MKYNFEYAKPKEPKILRFSDLAVGDVFFVATSHCRSLYMKIFGDRPNVVSLDAGVTAFVNDNTHVAKLITPITFYEDDFVDTLYQK